MNCDPARAPAPRFPILFFLFLLPALLFSQNGADRKNCLEKARLERNGGHSFLLYQQLASAGIRDDAAEEALFRLGQYYYAGGRYGPAVQVFDSLLLLFPEAYFKAEAEFWKALSYFSAGNKDSTVRILSLLGEEDPAVYVRGQIVLGVLLSRDGRYRESNQCLEKALKLGDNSLRSTAYFQLSQNYAALSDQKQAQVYAKKLLDEFPNAIEASQAEKILKNPQLPAAGAVSRPDETFTLQLGAFQNRENAEKLRKKYADTYGNADVVEVKRDGSLLYVLRLGKFLNAKDADAFASLELNLSPKEFKVVKR